MPQHTRGFTLLELLAVIAIVGVLAGLMIPRLLGARATAEERAAQSFGTQVYRSVFLWMADSTTRTVASVPSDCSAPYELPLENGQPAGFGWDTKPRAVDVCTIAPDPNFALQVTVRTTYGTTYVNGVRQ